METLGLSLRKHEKLVMSSRFLSRVSINQLVDLCKSCILIGYAASGLIVIVIE